MTSPFDSGTSGISLALDVPFPANVTSGPGVKIDKTTGSWIVGLNYPPLVDGGSPATPSNVFVAAWDAGLGIYEKLRLDNLIAGATGLDSRTPRGDANYSILISDRYVGLTAALTAVRTWTLPAASTVPGGRLVTIQDEAGGIAGANYLSIAPTGADLIDGVNVPYLLKARFGGLSFRSDGSSRWNIAIAPQRRAVADAAYSATQGDSVVAYTSIAAARVVTLPAASAFQIGQRLTVVDESGSCSATNSITLNRAGADTINGATSQVITQAYGYLALVSDGTSKWTIVDNSLGVPPASINGTPIGNTTPSTGAFTTLSVSGSFTQGAAIGVVTIANGGMAFGGTFPLLTGYVSGGAADQKYWDWSYASTTLTGRAVNDAYNSTNPWIVVNRGSGFTVSNVSFPAPVIVTSNAAAAFAAGRQGATNPGLNVQANDANCATGINVRSLPAGNGALVAAISSNAIENLVLDAKGAGVAYLGVNSTGGVNLASGGGSTAVTGPLAVGGALTLNGVPYSPLGQCRLIVASATQLRLIPYGGNMIKIAGQEYPIPSGGVNLANGTFASNTLYFIYAYQSAGVVILENSATGHGTDTNVGNFGVEVKSGDNSRTLVGMVQSNASSQFVDSDTQRFVLSWFNRQPKRLKNSYTANRTFSNNTMAEVNSEIRCVFLCWADDNPEIGLTGAMYMSAGAAGVIAGIGVDTFTSSVTPTTVSASSTVPSGGISKSGVGALAEGLHTFSVVGNAGSSSTGSLQKGTSVTGEQFPTLVGSIMG
jgi:hypothetical protein